MWSRADMLFGVFMMRNDIFINNYLLRYSAIIMIMIFYFIFISYKCKTRNMSSLMIWHSIVIRCYPRDQWWSLDHRDRPVCRNDFLIRSEIDCYRVSNAYFVFGDEVKVVGMMMPEGWCCTPNLKPYPIEAIGLNGVGIQMTTVMILLNLIRV